MYERPTISNANIQPVRFDDSAMINGVKMIQDSLRSVRERELEDQAYKDKQEALAYAKENDAFNRNRLINADKTAQEERDYLLGQRKNKEDFIKSISEPGVDALDDTIIKRTNELAASKWNESNPISDAEAARLNDYYARNENILNPTLDPENLRSYIGSQALKYGVDPSTATSTYEMFKDKKETGLTDMEKLLIQNELGMQRDVNKLNAEKALGNEKYDGKTGNTTTGAKKDKAGAIGSDFASNAAELNKLELDTDVIDALGATSEKEKALGLYTNLSKTYNPKDVANVIKASISSGGEINDDTVKTLLSNIPTNVSKSDANSTTGALEKVEYTPAIDLQSMIAKSTKVDKGKLAEDMFEREFGIPKGKSGGNGSSESYGKLYDGTIVERNKDIPLTVQFNNPGAIKQADQKDSTVKWKGQIGVDSQGHAIFDTPLSGAEAQVKNMLTQAGKDITLGEMVRNYATGNQKEYIDKISKETGIKENDKFEEDKIGDIVLAMSKFEAGSKNTPYTKSLYEQALNNVGKERSIKLTNALDKVIENTDTTSKAPVDSDTKANIEEVNKARQELLSKKEDEKKDNFYIPEYSPVIPSIRNKIAEDEKKLDNIKKEYESLSSKFKNDVSFEKYSKNKNIYDALYSSDYKK